MRLFLTYERGYSWIAHNGDFLEKLEYREKYGSYGKSVNMFFVQLYALFSKKIFSADFRPNFGRKLGVYVKM